MTVFIRRETKPDCINLIQAIRPIQPGVQSPIHQVFPSVGTHFYIEVQDPSGAVTDYLAQQYGEDAILEAIPDGEVPKRTPAKTYSFLAVPTTALWLRLSTESTMFAAFSGPLSTVSGIFENDPEKYIGALAAQWNAMVGGLEDEPTEAEVEELRAVVQGITINDDGTIPSTLS